MEESGVFLHGMNQTSHFLHGMNQTSHFLHGMNQTSHYLHNKKINWQRRAMVRHKLTKWNSHLTVKVKMAYLSRYDMLLYREIPLTSTSLYRELTRCAV